jgi:hypothetical protein
MPKKKVIAARTLKDCLPSFPLKTRKQKRKSKFFIATILCFPEEYSFAFMLGAPALLSCSASSSSFV